ncbi:alpha-L-fucosidase [Pedobacter nyackensis]|uniref:alpha-L-fucosidase n=1 Tax=Pedobacter nyackensis TaxID=475255 RepID=UPI002931CFAB|nr:alpha-L-fucosidase [Pedobacter nyackensis]
MNPNKTKFLFTLILSICYLFSAAQQISKLQLSQVKRGYGMFIHFGINTFNQIEWSDGKLPLSTYNPDQLDPDSWVKIAKEAGFKYVILITKHHEGFCLWDSKYTDYDVASSPVKTDVIAKVAEACKKYGLELGLYYSLWDRHEKSHDLKDPQPYVDFMKNQLTELLTNYGKICEIWFDGAWAKKDDDWKIPEVYAHIKKLQPNCLVTVNHTISIDGKPGTIKQPTDQQTGDKVRFWPVDFRTKDPNLARWDDPKIFDQSGKQEYLIFEHTLCLSNRWNWFQKKDNLPARELDELEELFYWTTANNNIMILNVPPDEHGQIREHEKNRIFELADRLGIRGGGKFPAGPTNLSFKLPVKATNSAKNDKFDISKINDFSMETYWTAGDTTASVEMDLVALKVINRITIFEHPKSIDLNDSFSTLKKYHIDQFSIELMVDGNWKTVYMGDEIGACKIIKLPVGYNASKLRLNILHSKSIPSIYHIGISNDTKKHYRKVLAK